MDWKSNAAMYWSFDNGATWNKISDHNRDQIDVTNERIEKKNRMVDGTLRKYTVAKKRSIATSWNSLPAKIALTYNSVPGLGTVDGGWAGEDIENKYMTYDGAFLCKLRKGIDEAKAITDGTIEVITVMFADFNKNISKRGIIDQWDVSITLEEV